MINLSKTQAEVVNFPIGGAMQILASAGAGKTRVLTERIRYILANTKKDGVIAFTFTNKAAEEMQTRLEDLDDAKDRCWVSTIHGIAQRVLEQYGHVIGLPSELHIFERDQDRKAVFLQSLVDLGLNTDVVLGSDGDFDKKNRERTIQRYMDQFSLIKRELLTEDEVLEQYQGTENFIEIYNSYQESLLASGGIDFDDILVYAHKILLDQPWCGDIYRAKYKHICVDEAQDLNRAQYEFVKALCGDTIKSILMVGDENQMIYGFNGSSEKYLCKNFITDFEPHRFQLKENYRSSRNVIHLANKIKPESQVETDYALQGYSDIKAYASEEEEASAIVKTIKALIDVSVHPEIEGTITLDKMVVIASNKFVFGCLEKELADNNIPYFLKKGERHVEPSSLFGKALDLSIRIKLNSKDWVDGKKLCSALKIQPLLNWDSEDVLADISNRAELSDINFSGLISSLIKDVDDLDVDNPAIPKFCTKYEKEIETMASDKGLSDEMIGDLERSLLELNEFKSYWTSFKRKGIGSSLSAFRNALALGQLSEDSALVGLTLSSVHTMKGLEKDIVFLMGMCEGVFPDYRSTTPKDIEEERNKAFVAITRARRWIYISYPQRRKMPWGDYKAQQPSRFLRQLAN